MDEAGIDDEDDFDEDADMDMDMDIDEDADGDIEEAVDPSGGLYAAGRLAEGVDDDMCIEDELVPGVL